MFYRSLWLIVFCLISVSCLILVIWPLGREIPSFEVGSPRGRGHTLEAGQGLV
jgi:hypothetical protein